MRRISFLACVPGVFSSHGRAFLRAGLTAQALRAAPLAHVTMHCRAVDGGVAGTGVISTIRCPATVCSQTVTGGAHLAYGQISGDLVQQFGQHWRIPNPATGHLDGADL